MVWLKTQGKHPDEVKTGTGKRLRDKHESILIAVRGAIPAALPMWPSVLIAPVGEHSEKPKALMEMIDRDYEPALVRIEMFAARRSTAAAGGTGATRSLAGSCTRRERRRVGSTDLRSGTKSLTVINSAGASPQ
jgi:N6-adenosine-specific RNA methylase IME4